MEPFSSSSLYDSLRNIEGLSTPQLRFSSIHLHLRLKIDVRREVYSSKKEILLFSAFVPDLERERRENREFLKTRLKFLKKRVKLTSILMKFNINLTRDDFF